MKLIVAGPGDFELALGRKTPANVEVIGPVGVEKRKDLLARAKAVLSLTRPYETFGLVAVEAMLSGTVPIAANSGGFQDTIDSGFNGYRIDHNNINAGVHAVENLDKINPFDLRDAGLRYSKEYVAFRYGGYLKNLGCALRGDNIDPILEPDWTNRRLKVEWPAEWLSPVSTSKVEKIEKV